MDTHCNVLVWTRAIVLFISALFLSSPIISAEEVTAHEHTSRPNIVFIMADDLGFNDIGYHNKKGVYTPFIDKLAQEGVRLENYYVQPICGPTRSQFMSGRSQIHTGLQHHNIMKDQPTGLPLDSPTLPDKLKEAGYATDMVGKWHLGFYHEDFLPTNRGFDTFYGLYLGGGNHFTHKSCFGKRCAVDLHNDTTTERRADSGQSGVYSTSLFTNEATRIIDHRSKGKDPFFMFLSYQAVHGPLQVPRHYKKVVGKKLGRRRLKAKRRKFVAMAYAMDCGVKRVVNSLKANGVWNNTVLVFSTDNGGIMKYGGSNYPLRGQKRSYFEGGVRGVGFVNSPLISKTGYVNKEMIHVTDWFPTFVSLANGNLNGTRDVNGFDQWETLSKGSPTSRDEILFNIDPTIKSRRRSKKDRYTPEVKPYDTRMLAALRKGDYKIITGLQKSQQILLYNVKDDPMEKKNLSKDPTLKSKIDEMLASLRAHQETAVPVYLPRGVRFRLGNSWKPWEKKLRPIHQAQATTS